ncbi:MAG: hypothetical protein ACP5N1_07255 [Candidatus Woesearchaeota archaeon]
MKWKEYNPNKMNSDELRLFSRSFSAFSNIKTSLEDNIRMTPEFAALVKNNERNWYILFKPNTVRIPNQWKVIGLQSEDLTNWYKFGSIYIPKVQIGSISDWPENSEAITGAGWLDKESMIEGLNNIYESRYGKLKNDDILSAWKLEYQGLKEKSIKSERKFHFCNISGESFYT